MALWRIAFFFIFVSKAQDFSGFEISKAFYFGTKFDVRVAAVLILPTILFAGIHFLSPLASEFKKKIWLLLHTFNLFILSTVYALDIGYYSYLEGRFNATALNFLENPITSAKMMMQTYPMFKITIAVLAMTYGIYKLLQKTAFNYTPVFEYRPIKKKVLTFIITFFVTLFALHGKLSQYPLRWSEAFFANNKFVSAIGLNPFHYFFDTYRNREEDYNLKALSIGYDSLATYLKVSNPSQSPFHLNRPLKVTGEFQNRPNIVIIVMESFAAFKSGTFGNPFNATPHFDKIAKEGLLFKNYYVQSEGTARSMFTLLTGIADINSNRTSSRNPLIVDQHTLLNAFKGYTKNYFIGGSANWGNIRGVYQNNVPDLNLFEEQDYKLPAVDVWGLSDLDLFKEAYRILYENDNDYSKNPFITIIQAASFHRPYTIPDSKDDFQLVKEDDKKLKKYGFVSNEELNSLRFSDYSLGKFFELYNQKPWSHDTIFVVVGDHGLPDFNAEHLSAGNREFGLERFHVPLLFYYPQKIRPGVRHTLAIEPDVLATLAGITNHPFTNSTFGQNLFAINEDDERYAFNYVYYAKPLQIHLYDQEHLLLATPKKTLGLFNYTSSNPKENLKDKLPKKYEKMSLLLKGFYEGSKFMLHHNKKSIVKENERFIDAAK